MDNALKLFCVLPFLMPLAAQQTVRVTADCVIGFTFTASGSTPVTAGNPNTGDNRQAGCESWTLQYQSTGFSAVTLTIQSAPGSITPGTFVTYAGTIDTGVNPNTSLTGATTTAHNATIAIPWIRVNAALTGTGTLNGVLYGIKSGPTVVVTATLTPSGTQNVNLIQVDGTAANNGGVAGGQGVGGVSAPGAAAGNPVLTGTRDDSGNALPNYAFPDQAAVSISSGTDTVMVAGVAGKLTYVGAVSASLLAAQTVTFQQGTGVTCGTNTVILYGPFQGVVSIALDPPIPSGIFHTTVTGSDLCMHLGGSTTAGGGITYGQH